MSFPALICDERVGTKESKAPRFSRGEIKKIRIGAIVRTDVWYHPTKFQFNQIRTLGCESISRLQKEKMSRAGGENLLRFKSASRVKGFSHPMITLPAEKAQRDDHQLSLLFYILIISPVIEVGRSY